MAPTCFGLRPSSGSLQLNLAKVILILKHSVRLRHNLLCGGVAALLSITIFQVVSFRLGFFDQILCTFFVCIRLLLIIDPFGRAIKKSGEAIMALDK